VLVLSKLIVLAAAGLLYSLLRTSANHYGVPPPVAIVFYALCINFAVISLALATFSWAEALNNKSMRLSTGFLDKYKTAFYIYVAYRIIGQTLLGVFSALNINDSYYIVFRIWLLELTLALAAMFFFLERVSRKLLNLMDQFGVKTDSKRRVCPPLKRFIFLARNQDAFIWWL